MEKALGDFLAKATDADRMLLDVLEILYVGRWEDLLEDLQAASQGKPHVFKIADRVQEDLARARKMWELETKYGVRLRSLIGESGDDKVD